MQTTSMFIEPLRNKYWQTYEDVITFNSMPEGPIGRLVKTVRPPKLSPFQSVSDPCKMVLMRTSGASEKTPQSYMTSGDLPSVMDYLYNNGYVVDTNIPGNMSLAGIYLGGNSEGEKRCVAIIHHP
jgi:hypothetical protein